MKKLGMNAAVIVLALGAAAFAQQDQPRPGEDKPPAQQKQVKPAHPTNDTRPDNRPGEKPSPARVNSDRVNNDRVNNSQPKRTQQDAKGAQDQARQAKQDEAKEAQVRNKQAQDNAKRNQKDDARRAQDQTRIAQNRNEQTQAAQRSDSRGGDRGRIPDDKFRAHFGHDHHFHVGHPVMVDNRPRFQYSGYWFQFADAWPAGWSYDDDCYIDYVDDGYYLFDPVHPGMRIAVTIVM